MKLTRRKLAAVVVGSSVSALAQQTQPAATASPDEELRLARGRLRAGAEALDGIKVEMPVEPAFQFKA